MFLFRRELKTAHPAARATPYIASVFRVKQGMYMDVTIQLFRQAGKPAEPREQESGKRDLNPRHPPWQGGALPTELFPRVLYHCERRDLNPQAFWAPDPKSGVSAKFHHSRLDSSSDTGPQSIRPHYSRPRKPLQPRRSCHRSSPSSEVGRRAPAARRVELADDGSWDGLPRSSEMGDCGFA